MQLGPHPYLKRPIFILKNFPQGLEVDSGNLEDHPMTGKVVKKNMVIVSPQDLRLLFPFQMTYPWLINRGDPNHLQVLDDPPRTWNVSFFLIRLDMPNSMQ